MTVLRALMLLALIVWIGGISFFSFILAPTVFAVLPTTALAGNVVSRSLAALHWMGIVAAIVFLASSLLYSRAKFALLKPFALVNVLVVFMLVLTLVSQLAVTPRIHALRAEIQSAGGLAEPARTEFNRLHEWSARLEGGVLILGIVVVFGTARRFS